MYLLRNLKIYNGLITRPFSTSNKLRTIRLSDRPRFPLVNETAQVVENTGIYNIFLDNRLLLTPLGKVLSTKSSKLADLIRGELEAKKKELTRFNDLPYTMLLSNSLDLTPDSKTEHVRKLKDAINTDTVLFFEKAKLSGETSKEIPNLDTLSDSKLESLKKFDLEVVQTFFFTPVLESFSKFFRVPPLITSDNVSKTPSQHPDTVAVLNSFVDSLNIFQLVSAINTHYSLKSIILTVLFFNDLITSTRAMRVSRIEETVQSCHWGVTDTFDSEEVRILTQLDTCLNFYKLNS